MCFGIDLVNGFGRYKHTINPNPTMAPIDHSFLFTICSISGTLLLVIMGLLAYRFSDFFEKRAKNRFVKLILLAGILVAMFVAMEATGSKSQAVHTATMQYIRIVQR